MKIKTIEHKAIVLDAKRKEYADAGSALATPENVTLKCGDFRELMTELPDDSIDLIFTDPPYDKESIPLYGDLARLAALKLKSGGSLLAYAGHYALPEIFALMMPHLRYWWIIACNHQNGNRRFPGKNVIVQWKPIVWFVKGGVSHTHLIPDSVQSGESNKTLHEWGQSITEAQYYIAQLHAKTVLDPFMGSGTTGLAAAKLGVPFIGFDIDRSNVDIARKRFNEHQPA